MHWNFSGWKWAIVHPFKAVNKNFSQIGLYIDISDSDMNMREWSIRPDSFSEQTVVAQAQNGRNRNKGRFSNLPIVYQLYHI